MPQLVAMFAAVVFAHTERAATHDVSPGGALSLLPELPGRECKWCHRPLPPGVHRAQRYCPGGECRRQAYNAWQRAGRPKGGMS